MYRNPTIAPLSQPLDFKFLVATEPATRRLMIVVITTAGVINFSGKEVLQSIKAKIKNRGIVTKYAIPIPFRMLFQFGSVDAGAGLFFLCINNAPP